jgi:nitrogen fixation protein FixH
MTKRFTGWHMTAILIAFFGVIVAVNSLMATIAARTFGGVVVENSYVASQQFNGWLKAAKRQEQLGWHPKVALDSHRRVTVALPVTGAQVTGYAEHPLGRAADVPLTFTGAKAIQSDQPLPAGRWTVHLVIRRGADEARIEETLS